jgi:hypothetical protein
MQSELVMILFKISNSDTQHALSSYSKDFVLKVLSGWYTTLSFRFK